jgi:hypothetical protein
MRSTPKQGAQTRKLRLFSSCYLAVESPEESADIALDRATRVAIKQEPKPPNHGAAKN